MPANQPKSAPKTAHRLDSWIERARLFRPFRSNAVWALLDQGFVSVCNFTTIFLIARFTSAETLGLFVLLYSILLLATDLQHASLTQAHNVLVPQLSTRETNSFTSVLFELQLAGGTVTALLFGLAAVLFQYAGSTEVAHAVLWLSITALPWLIQDAIRRVMYTAGDSRSALKNDALSYGLQALSIAVLVTGQTPRVGDLYAVIGMSSGVAVVYGLWQLRKHLHFVRPSSPSFCSITRRIWQFSRWLTGSEVLHWIGRHGNVWVLGAFVGIGPVGTFKAVIQLTNILNPIKLATFTYLPSRASRILHETGKDSFRRWLMRVGGLILIPYTMVILTLIVFSRQILHFAYNGHYDGSGLAIILSLGALGHLLYFVRSLIQIDLISRGRNSAIFTDSFLSVVMLLTIGVFSISILGIKGAVIFEIIMASALILYNVLVYRGKLDPGDVRDRELGTDSQERAAADILDRSQLIDRGSEANIYLTESKRTVIKVYEGDNKVDKLRNARYEFETLKRLERQRTGVGCVDLPRVIRLSTNPAAVEMTRLKGLPLLDLIASTDIDSGDVPGIAVKLLAGLTYVSRLLKGPYRDFSVRNVLMDPATGRLSFLDFGPGQWNAITQVQSSSIATSVGHFVGDGLYQLTRPEFVANGRLKRLMPELCSALLMELAEHESVGLNIMDDLHHFMDEKFSANTSQGGLIRRSWYASFGNARFRMHTSRLRRRFPTGENEV